MINIFVLETQQRAGLFFMSFIIEQTCQLPLIQSETQAIFPFKIRLQSEKEWDNYPALCIYDIIEQKKLEIA